MLFITSIPMNRWKIAYANASPLGLRFGTTNSSVGRGANWPVIPEEPKCRIIDSQQCV